MRHRNRYRLDTRFRGSPIPRLASMIVMLGVIVLMMTRARDPDTWRWLTGEARQDDAANERGQHATSSPSGSDNMPVDVVPFGLTDEDPEEWDAAREEFQAMSDATLGMSPEEMPAYWRLVNWAQHHPLAKLEARAKAASKVTFSDMMLHPDEQRGKLIHLDFHLRRAIFRSPGADNPAGITELYEAMGWTDETKSWLYVLIFADRPPGMPISNDIYEDVSFDGYFLKLQGYLEAGAKPRDPPLKAPLLIGRVVWHPAALPQQTTTDWTWPMIAGAGLIAFVLIARWFMVYITPRAETSLRRSRHGGAGEGGDVPIDGWLQRAQENANYDEPPPCDNPSTPIDKPDDDLDMKRLHDDLDVNDPPPR